MNNIEIMAFCDKYLRYDGSNTGIRGIAYYENKGMFWVRHEGESHGQDGDLITAFRTLIEIAYRKPMTLTQQHYALLYLADPKNKVPAT